MRVIFFTGKGGVGKSTLSCATAARVADNGKKVVIASLDLAHNLRDILGDELKRKNIHIIEFDPDSELRKTWNGIYKFIKDFIESQGLEEVYAEEMVLLPGMEEVLFFISLLKIIESNKYEVLIVDGPPTASSLKFLSLPETFRWYKNKFFSRASKRYIRVKPIMEKYFYTPLPDKNFIEDVEMIYEKILNLHSILKDPSKTSFRIVTIPSEIAFKETLRLYSVLSLFEYPVDGIILNRFSKDDEIFNRLKTVFSPLPIMVLDELKDEPLGLDSLSYIGDRVYRDWQPDDFLSHNQPFKVVRKNSSTTIEFFLPGIKKEEIEMWIDGNELVIKSGAFKRVMFLKLNGKMDVGEVNFSDGWLRISLLKDV